MAINPLPLAGVGLAAVAVAGGLYATGTGTAKELEITATTIASETTQTEYTGKYGDYFRHHFISATDTKNKAWWDKSFQRLSIEKAKEGTDMNDEFKKAIASSEADTTKHLSQICLTAYKLDYSTLSATDKTNYLRDLWRYCSLEGEQPEVLSTTTTTGDKMKEKHITKLVAIDGNKNLKFWKIQEETFFKKGDGQNAVHGMGNSSTAGTTFNTLYTTKVENEPKTVKGTCKAAHDQQNANGLEADTLKFCSIAGAVASAGVGG